MTSVRDQAVAFTCEGETLIGVLCTPADHVAHDLALVIVVGGPQYRVGAHRQFVELSRHIAAAGHAVLRFDTRGMGDSTGRHPGFEGLGADIESAIDALQAQQPQVRRVALWGLCDGASASAIYVAQRRDPRVVALAMLNPWVRSADSLARTQLRHWYLRRLMQRSFWTALLRGGIGLRAVHDLAANAWQGLGRPSAAQGDFRARMLVGAQAVPGPVLVHLADNDQTAQEFAGVLAGTQGWRQLQSSGRLRSVRLVQADHTLTSPAARRAVEQDVAALLATLARPT
jgi:exosortase A-associated hydrolase 1